MADCTTPLGRPEKSIELPKLMPAGSIVVFLEPNPFSDNDEEYIQLTEIIIDKNVLILNAQFLDKLLQKVTYF